MLNNFAGVVTRKYIRTDYLQRIKELHSKFALPFDEGQLVKGDSTSPEIVEKAGALGPFDIVYIDGCHEYDFVVKDIKTYGGMVKIGGYLVMDDASNRLHIPQGRLMFRGKEGVSRAVQDKIVGNPMWKEVLVVLHNRVFRRVR